MDADAALLPGLFIHNKPNCAAYQALAADVRTARVAMAIYANTAITCLRAYERLASRHARALSMRQSVGAIENIRKLIEAMNVQLQRMRNDMPVVPAGGQKGGQP